MKTVSRLVVVALALGHLTCNQAILTAGPGSTLRLSANPPFIAAQGGVSVVTAVVIEQIGTPVPDGTVVQFFTDLGDIEEQGRTNDGVARVNLIADSRSGSATVTAISGPVSQTAVGLVKIGAIRPHEVIITADPPRIPANSRSTHLVATVIDEFGNPVPNQPVVFRVSSNPATESVDSGSNPLYTDTNGRAEDTLRTRRTPGTPGTAVVEVVVLSGPNPIIRSLSIPLQ
jgi:Big-like domain-containing protein